MTLVSKTSKLKGVIGRGSVLTIKDDSENSALMRLAAICTNSFVSKTTDSNSWSFKLENTHKREIFRQFYKVVVEWCNDEHVRIPPQIIAKDTSISDSITDMVVEEIFRIIITDELDWETSLHSILDNFQPSGFDQRY